MVSLDTGGVVDKPFSHDALSSDIFVAAQTRELVLSLQAGRFRLAGSGSRGMKSASARPPNGPPSRRRKTGSPGCN